MKNVRAANRTPDDFVEKFFAEIDFVCLSLRSEKDRAGGLSDQRQTRFLRL